MFNRFFKVLISISYICPNKVFLHLPIDSNFILLIAQAKNLGIILNSFLIFHN
jgi:hypothetical protein